MRRREGQWANGAPEGRWLHNKSRGKRATRCAATVVQGTVGSYQVSWDDDASKTIFIDATVVNV